LLILLTLLLASCKRIQRKSEIPANTPLAKEMSLAERIANAHGYENWKNVSKIEFIFNVNRGENHSERSWSWEPKKDIVTFSADSTVVYNRNDMDSTSIKIDRSFINDKFWLLIPFQLVWDKGTSISEPVMAEAPISKSQMHKITLTYP